MSLLMMYMADEVYWCVHLLIQCKLWENTYVLCAIVLLYYTSEILLVYCLRRWLTKLWNCFNSETKTNE